MTKTKAVLRSTLLPLAFGLAALSSGPTQAQDVAALSVSGARPTTMTVRVSGLEIDQIRREVRTTAVTVCRNAAFNRELEFYDIDWCAQATTGRTMRGYRAALRDADGQVQTASISVSLAAR